jgi:hypothetical protein
MTRSAIWWAFGLLAVGSMYAGCTQDFSVFETGGGGPGGSSSSSLSTGGGGSGVPCDGDGDCNDDNPCTDDSCGANDFCVFDPSQPRPGLRRGSERLRDRALHRRLVADVGGRREPARRERRVHDRLLQRDVGRHGLRRGGDGVRRGEHARMQRQRAVRRVQRPERLRKQPLHSIRLRRQSAVPGDARSHRGHGSMHGRASLRCRADVLHAAHPGRGLRGRGHGLLRHRRARRLRRYAQLPARHL